MKHLMEMSVLDLNTLPSELASNSFVEGLLGKSDEQAAGAKDRYMQQVLQELKKREKTGGFRNYFVPGTKYGIDKCPKHKAFFSATGPYSEVQFRAGNRCLAEGTLVMTPKGPCPIEKIQVNDWVYDRYGNPTRVVATWDNGTAEVVTLTNRNKEYLKCTPNHEMDCYLVSRHSAKFDPATNKEGRVHAGLLDEFSPVRTSQVKAPLGDISVPEAYFLGAMLGDGCCTCATTNTMIVSSADSNIPNRLADIVGGTVKKVNSSNYSWSIRADKPERYMKWMHNLKAHEKTVDLEDIKTWDRTSVLAFVAGLIDTDGSLSKSKDGFALALTSQNPSILDAFEYCVLALWQTAPTRCLDNRAKYVNGPCFSSIVRNPHKIKQIADELGPVLTHKYKADVTGIEKIGKRSRPEAIRLSPSTTTETCRVYDITVEHPEHFYLLANGLSVSNCGKSVAGAFSTALWLVQDYPDWWLEIGARVFKCKTNILACGQTNESTRNIVQKEMLGELGNIGTGMIPAEHIRKVWNKPQTPGTVDTVEVLNMYGDVCKLVFKSYEQKIETFVGTAYHAAWPDEEPPHGHYREIVMRTSKLSNYDRRGVVINTVTPINGVTPFIGDFDKTSDHLEGAARVTADE